MTTQAVTVHLPTRLYERLQQQAARAQRSVEDEVLEAVATTVPIGDELPDDLADALSPLALLDDEALWHAARSALPREAAEEMEALHLKRQRAGLTPSEAQRLATLVRQYEHYMLVRAQAAVLLQARGHDISALLNDEA